MVVGHTSCLNNKSEIRRRAENDKPFMCCWFCHFLPNFCGRPCSRLLLRWSYENIENSIHVVLVQTDVVLTDEALNIIAGIFHLSHVGPPLSVRSLKNKYRKAKRNKTVF